jgi:hypothetical protein
MGTEQMRGPENEPEGPENEPVEPLDGPVEAFGRVIEGSDARIVTFKATIARIKTGLCRDKKVHWLYNPVDLLDSTGNLIGFASLFAEGDRIVAEMTFDYATPDRLTLETNAYPLWAYPIASYGEKWVYIFAVKLDSQRPADLEHESVVAE